MEKVTKSLTLVSFKNVSLVNYAYQYEVSISYGSKVMAKVKVCFATESQTKSQPGQKLDASKFLSGVENRSDSNPCYLK